jgi:hypothetical protein
MGRSIAVAEERRKPFRKSLIRQAALVLRTVAA